MIRFMAALAVVVTIIGKLAVMVLVALSMMARCLARIV